MDWAMTEKSYSQRRACALVCVAPKTYRYASPRGDDAELRAAMTTLANERRRFGYRRLHLLRRRQGSQPVLRDTPDRSPSTNAAAVASSSARGNTAPTRAFSAESSSSHPASAPDHAATIKAPHRRGNDGTTVG